MTSNPDDKLPFKSIITEIIEYWKRQQICIRKDEAHLTVLVEYLPSCPSIVQFLLCLVIFAFEMIQVTNIIALSHGAALAWLSPTLLLLTSADTPLSSGPINVNEASWLGSLLCIGGFTGNLLFGFIANQWGRKRALCLIPFPQMCFWIIVLFANQIEVLYVGRILAGLTGGGSFVTIPLYISDIAGKEVRGRLGSILMLAVNCGTLIGYVVGSYVPYTIVPKVMIFLPLTAFCLILFFPETPQFLLMSKGENAARKSLCFYRNLDVNSNAKGVKEEIQMEMDEMKSVMGSSPLEKATLKDFVHKDAQRGMFLGFGLVAVNIFSGIFLIVNYNATIFKEAGTDIAPNVAAIIVAISQITGTYLSTLIADHFQRKTLLISTTAMATISLSIMGAATFLIKFYDMSELSWVPVASLSLTVFSASCGYIPLTFVVLNEVIPRKVRPIVASICNGMLNLFGFTSLKLLPMLIAYTGIYTVMWICAGMCFLGVLFNAIFVPETRGKAI